MGFCNSFIFILRRAHTHPWAAREGGVPKGGGGHSVRRLGVSGGRIMPPLEVAAKHLLTPKDDDEQQQQQKQ